MNDLIVPLITSGSSVLTVLLGFWWAWKREATKQLAKDSANAGRESVDVTRDALNRLEADNERLREEVQELREDVQEKGELVIHLQSAIDVIVIDVGDVKARLQTGESNGELMRRVVKLEDRILKTSQRFGIAGGGV